MAAYSSNLLLLKSLTRNDELLKLFKQMSFLIHRNTYGGLNIHDLAALSVIKTKLRKSLDNPEKEYLTRLIDSLSLYDLAEITTNSVTDKLLENEFFQYISKQSHEDLCDILIECLPAHNALLLSIEINDNALALVTALAEFSATNAPDKITDVNLTRCNIWEIIKDPNQLPKNHINIAFITRHEEPTNFLCFKGLCIAQQYLDNTKKPVIKKTAKEREKKPFMPSYSHGIVSLVRKVTGKPMNSRVKVVVDMEAKKEKESVKVVDMEAKKEKESVKKDVFGFLKKHKKNGVDETPTQIISNDDVLEPTITKIEVLEQEEDDTMTALEGRGFFDIEQGFLLSIT